MLAAPLHGPSYMVQYGPPSNRPALPQPKCPKCRTSFARNQPFAVVSKHLTDCNGQFFNGTASTTDLINLFKVTWDACMAPPIQGMRCVTAKHVDGVAVVLSFRSCSVPSESSYASTSPYVRSHDNPSLNAASASSWPISCGSICTNSRCRYGGCCLYGSCHLDVQHGEPGTNSYCNFGERGKLSCPCACGIAPAANAAANALTSAQATGSSVPSHGISAYATCDAPLRIPVYVSVSNAVHAARCLHPGNIATRSYASGEHTATAGTGFERAH